MITRRSHIVEEITATTATLREGISDIDALLDEVERLRSWRMAIVRHAEAVQMRVPPSDQNVHGLIEDILR